MVNKTAAKLRRRRAAAVGLAVTSLALALIGCGTSGGDSESPLSPEAQLGELIFNDVSLSVQRRPKPQRVKHLHGVGAHLHGGTHLAQLQRLLVHTHPVPAPHQTGRRHQAANAGAHDRNLHGQTTRNLVSMQTICPW